ncbi:methyltransferase, partial [Burkholderia pseudomallei]
TDRSGLFIFHALRARVESARRAFDSSRLVHERVPACTRSPHLIHSRIPP